MTTTQPDAEIAPSAADDLWHADDDGYCSQFAPGIPEWNLRGIIHTGADGRFTFHTVQPAPYQIPTDGSCGALIAAAGWAPVAPGAPAPEGLRPGQAADHHPALLRRRRVRRGRRRAGRQA